MPLRGASVGVEQQALASLSRLTSLRWDGVAVLSGLGARKASVPLRDLSVLAPLGSSLRHLSLGVPFGGSSPSPQLPRLPVLARVTMRLLLDPGGGGQQERQAAAPLDLRPLLAGLVGGDGISSSLSHLSVQLVGGASSSPDHTAWTQAPLLPLLPAGVASSLRSLTVAGGGEPPPPAPPQHGASHALQVALPALRRLAADAPHLQQLRLLWTASEGASPGPMADQAGAEPPWAGCAPPAGSAITLADQAQPSLGGPAHAQGLRGVTACRQGVGGGDAAWAAEEAVELDDDPRALEAQDGGGGRVSMTEVDGVMWAVCGM